MSIDWIKLQAFAARLEADQLVGLVRRGVDCQGNREGCKVSHHIGSKYTRVDIGTSGRYMVHNDTGEIFGIKGYGRVHPKYRFGTLDTVDLFYWGDYYAERI